MLEILLQLSQHQLKQIYRRLPRPFELVKQITYLAVADPGPWAAPLDPPLPYAFMLVTT